MVVLTLHRDEPLSTDEIRLLPTGCYPVMALGDVVARAELALPTAHIARFAADMARAIPDADFVAEERPSARAVALVSAAELDDPYWAYTPPLTFRADPPGAASLAEGPGRPSLSAARHEEDEPAPEVQQMMPETPQSLDFVDLVNLAQRHHTVDPEPAPEPPPAPAHAEVEVRESMSLSDLVSRLRDQAPAAPKARVEPVGEVRTGSAGVPQHILDMLQSIRAQEAEEGRSLLPVEGVEPEPIRPAVPQPGPGAVVAAAEPVQDGFWGRVASGDLEGAEALVRAEGLDEGEQQRIISLLVASDAAQVVLGLRVSRLVSLPGAGRVARRLLHHPEPEVRRELARTLGALRDEDGEADLTILSRDRDISVSDVARAALRRLQKGSRF
jgi:hypothetical protein